MNKDIKSIHIRGETHKLLVQERKKIEDEMRFKITLGELADNIIYKYLAGNDINKNKEIK